MREATLSFTFIARVARCGRRTVYEWLAADERFKALYSEAQEDAIDQIELEARRRAVDGVDVPVFHGGVQIGAIRRYSDNLLIRLLKRARPHVFGAAVDTQKREHPTSTPVVLVSYGEHDTTRKNGPR